MALWALLCFLFFGEETSWLQHFLRYPTPAWMVQENARGEFNLHNLRGLHGGALLGGDFQWRALLKAQNLFNLGFLTISSGYPACPLCTGAPPAFATDVHLFAYLATVLILFFVNLTVTPNVWWFYWVALGWGAGIIAHGWCASGKRRPLPRPEASADKAVTKSKPQRSKSAPRRKSPKKSG